MNEHKPASLSALAAFRTCTFSNTTLAITDEESVASILNADPLPLQSTTAPAPSPLMVMLLPILAAHPPSQPPYVPAAPHQGELDSSEANARVRAFTDADHVAIFSIVDATLD